MSTMTGHRPGWPLGALAAVVLLVVLAVPVRGATSVELQVDPLLGGRYTAGGWLALSVALRNDGAPTDGYVVAEGAHGTVRRYVELPAGARKSVPLYLRPDAFQRQVTVTFSADEGTVSASTEVRVLERSSHQVAIVGDGGGNLRPQLPSGEDFNLREPLSIGVAEIPERAEPLTGIATIVWAGDSSALTEPQRRSLEHWVAAGGQLVVVGGPDWQSRSAAFVDLLPVEGITGVDDADLAGLATFVGSAAPEAAGRGAAVGAALPDAIALADGTDGGPLLAMIRRGAGRVVYSAVDLATAPFRAWEGAPLLWSRLLPNDGWTEEFRGPAESELESSMGQAVGTIPSLEVPPAELLLLVIVGYIVLIGPISYIVLRRLDRRELAWITAPILVVMFSACSYGVGSAMKGGDIILNQISVMRSAEGGSAAMAEVFAGLFSPSRATYDLTVEADALVAPLRLSGFEGVPAGGRADEILVEQGQPAHLRGLSLGVFGFEGIRANAVVEYSPGLEVTWRLADGELVGTVTNLAETRAEDVAVVSSSFGRRIGDLEPGASAPFSVRVGTFGGTSASEQVYGFGGWDASDETQRQNLVRRQVIDGLVGYGGFAGRGVGFGGPDRGPFVIGWRDAESPVQVSVDGHTVQRHEQVVEVISGRPTLGPGVVSIGAGQMSVQVAGTDGDADASQVGSVAIGTGEAVFAINLPLEAAGMQPTEVEVVVGPDALSVASDPGAFGGFFGPGYTVSVREAATGEWLELGALDRETLFTVDDPVAVIGETGRIEVRIVGEGADEQFGVASLFASASVTGTIDR